jgi:hypothetical protein
MRQPARSATGIWLNQRARLPQSPGAWLNRVKKFDGIRTGFCHYMERGLLRIYPNAYLVSVAG